VVFPSTDHSTWAQPDRAAGLQFVWAGKLAEMEVLDDAIPGGEVSDLRAWRHGVGRLGAMTFDELDALIGCAHQDLYCETERLLEDTAASIDRLATHLGTLPRPSMMTYDEVVTFLGQDSGTA
jgi:hypothetical protein